MIAKKTFREIWPMLLIYTVVMEIILLPAIVLWPDLKFISDQLGPIWVVPFRIDHRVRLTRVTGRVLQLRARSVESGS